MGVFVHVVEMAHSERELRHRRKEKLCHFYVRLCAWGVCVMVAYVLFGYFGKLMWYHDDVGAISYRIDDWEQVSSVAMGFLILWGFYAAMKWYCPLCHRYSSYERNRKKQRQFWLYQVALVVWIIAFACLVELIELAFED